MDNVAVPFRVERYGHSYTSQITTNGVIRKDGDDIVIEFRETTTDWTSMGMTTGKVEAVRIPLSDVESVTVSRKWPWGAWLALRTRTLSVLANYAASTGNECRFRVRRGDHVRARELAIAVSMHLVNEEMRRLDEPSA